MGSILETRFNDHPLWVLINQITGELESLALPDDADLADSLSRLQWLAKTIEAHRQEDPRRYSTGMLDNVHIVIQASILPHLCQYAQHPDGFAPCLRTAADGIDAVLDQMGTWPALSPKGAAAEEQLHHQVAAIREAVVAESATITQYKRDLEKELANCRANIDDLEETLVAAVLGATRDLACLEEMRGQGAKVLTALTQRAVADDYGKNARNKALAGWTWDLLGLAVGGVPLAVFSSTSITVTRFGLTLAAIGLACLCFTRGSANHRESRRAKRADLRLRTVHGFIANQPDEVKEAVLEGMANRIYLQGILESDDDRGSNRAELATYLARARSRRQANDYDN